jgi:hypothetical protein
MRKNDAFRRFDLAKELEELDEIFARKDGHPFGIGDRMVIIEKLERKGYQIVRKKLKTKA